MRTRSWTLMALGGVLAAGAVLAGWAPAALADEAVNYLDDSKVKVVVTFDEPLASKLPQIAQVEQALEERFRKTRHYGRSYREGGVFRNTRVSHANVRWANELLIPEVEQYTLPNLIAAITRYELEQAVPDFRGEVKYHIDTIKVANHDVALLNGASSYVIGSVEVRDANGNLVGKADKVSANLVVDYTVDSSYQGPKLAFAETDEHNRLGPTVTYFVSRALARVWPDREDKFLGPMIVRISGPNEQVLFNN
ncbi:MAG: hypothetical protein KatS3mg119_2134 [Rhodothalassiaceae bacterium]|nr:MAG: hypothetical protein KatS3mg119_2134 [Rhodothalassiaceae bacterium]